MKEKSKPQTFDIQVLANEEGTLISPIYIGIQKITQLGVYKIYGVRWWVIRFCPSPSEQVKLPERLDFDKLNIVRIDPEKRRFVQELQITLNKIRNKLNELIDYLEKKERQG